MTVSGNEFKIICPIHTLTKGGDQAEGKMWIGGLVSTGDLDQENETVIQKGLNFGPFLEKGWYNENHSQKLGDLLGYPTDAFYVTAGTRLPDGEFAKSNGWWAEGYLLDTPKGRETFELAKALEGTPRRLGFSIEGKVLERDPVEPSIVLRGLVRNVAITQCAVNDVTGLSALAKALTAGSAIENPGAAPGSGFPLRAESLDKQDHESDLYIEPSWLTQDEAKALVRAARPDLTDDAISGIIQRAIT